jgi:hypothetical protein
MHRTNTMRRGSLATIVAAWVLAAACGVEAAAPSPEERQLPRAMRSAMAVRPSVTVGPHDADLVGMAAHRNRLVENVIEDNGGQASAAGIRVRGEANDLVFERNVIRDTRHAAARTQTTGIRIDAKVGPLEFDNNQIDAEVPIDDRRPVAGRKGNDSEGQSADGTS